MGLFTFLPGPLRGAFFTVGASAPLFGLFGALVFYGQRTGNRCIRVAVNEDDGRLVGVGKNAKEMYGKTSKAVRCVRQAHRGRAT